MKRPRIAPSLLALLLAIAIVPASKAAPAHVVRFLSAGQPVGCTTIRWQDVLTFYNASDSAAVVRVLGISNGGAFRTNPDQIDVPPRTMVWADAALAGAWLPQNGDKLWVMHLEVPMNVIVESRNEMIQGEACVLTPVPLFSLGKVSLPVFTAAVPAGQAQTHLGTDVGSKDARINVGIYNQGAVLANAHIEIRRSCDNSIVDMRDVQIPADTIVQFTGFQKGSNSCSPSGTTPNWLRYTVITVDQPSMTYAAALTEKRNEVPGLAPEVGISMPLK